MFQKLEKVVYVDNISLCDESKCRKISENKLHQTSKFPHKWKEVSSKRLLYIKFLNLKTIGE